MKKAALSVLAAACGVSIVACGPSKEEIEAREKAELDSIDAVEKAKADSIDAVEKTRTDSLSAIETTGNVIVDSLQKPIMQHPREKDFLPPKQVWMRPRKVIIIK